LEDFDYFIVFYALLLGLAMTELLSGYANLVRAKTRPAWGAIAPLIGLLIFVEIAVSFIDAWANLRCVHVQLTELALPTVMALTYYGAAVIAVPREHSEWASLDDYFYGHRKWLAGLLIAANLLHLWDEWPSVRQTWARGETAALREYVASNLWLFGSYLVIFFSRARWLTVPAILSVLAFFAFVYSHPDFGVLAAATCSG
jgi:hypothetical protein